MLTLLTCGDMYNSAFLQLSHKIHCLLTTSTLNEPIVVYVNCTASWSHDDVVGGAVSLLPDHSKDTASR